MHADELLITPPVPRAKGQLLEGFKYCCLHTRAWFDAVGARDHRYADL